MSTPVYDRWGVQVFQGDCLDVMREMPDCSVSAVVTDPPYGLGNPDPTFVIKALTRWFAGERDHVPDSRGFMGRAWDAFVPPPAVWDECYRVLKPGGHLLAFAGTRTADLMGLSIRLAGFEFRDEIDSIGGRVSWCYGSGFPKALDVSQAIDREAGAEREVTRIPTRAGNAERRGAGDQGSTYGDAHGGFTTLSEPVMDAARQWSGWYSALKPSHEPIIVARKPFTSTVAANVVEHGTGALNIGATRVTTTDDLNGGAYNAGGRARPPSGDLREGASLGMFEPGQAAHGKYQQPAGRWPPNTVLSHSPLVDPVTGEVIGDACAGGCVEGCPVAELDRQSGGVGGSPGSRHMKKEAHTQTTSTWGSSAEWSTGGFNDTGGASRFFPRFRWEAKAPAAERPRVNGVAHPTCKPLGLIRWLSRLVTPPGGVILDPFLGSGTTAQAARAEGFRCIGIEREADYLPLIVARLDALPKTDATTTPAAEDDGPVDLFGLLEGEAS